MIPESQCNKTLVTQPSVSLFIMKRLFSVLTAIEFDNQPFLQTYEINNVITQRLLSSKFKPIDLRQTQFSPKQAFAVCRILSQLPCSRARLANIPPYPYLSPQGGKESEYGTLNSNSETVSLSSHVNHW